jgi:hypothetical protein
VNTNSGFRSVVVVSSDLELARHTEVCFQFWHDLDLHHFLLSPGMEIRGDGSNHHPLTGS